MDITKTVISVLRLFILFAASIKSGCIFLYFCMNNEASRICCNPSFSVDLTFRWYAPKTMRRYWFISSLHINHFNDRRVSTINLSSWYDIQFTVSLNSLISKYHLIKAELRLRIEISCISQWMKCISGI